ncbi:MAG: hypothetical protein E6G56_05390 [Actinobacteria bacterium]|nr:MAG: hypothetical protein E6G56_05390 [Actinomycetota bacterium]
MLSITGRRLLRLTIAVAVLASLATAAVATARHGRGDSPGRHYARYGATGWVTAHDGSTLTLRDSRARSHSFALSSSTSYSYADGSAATGANVTPNTVVRVRATAPTTSGGNPVAQSVVIQLARIGGLVQSDSGGTLNVVDDHGFARVIRTTAATTCRQRRAAVDCTTIAAGSVVQARGKVDADGVALDASRVQVTPPSS